MRAILLSVSLFIAGIAQAQSSQPSSAPALAASQPTSSPAIQAAVALAASQPTSEAAQCAECLTSRATREPSYKAAKILGLSGVAGLYVSFKGMGAFEQLENPMMKASVGLGVASLTSLNASVAALGITRYQKTGKLRPLLISTLFSGALVLGHFTMGMAVAWSQDSAIEPEPGQEETDVADAVAGTFLAGSGTAFLISSGLLLKTSKEALSWYVQRREERLIQKSELQSTGGSR